MAHTGQVDDGHAFLCGSSLGQGLDDPNLRTLVEASFLFREHKFEECISLLKVCKLPVFPDPPSASSSLASSFDLDGVSVVAPAGEVQCAAIVIRGAESGSGAVGTGQVCGGRGTTGARSPKRECLLSTASMSLFGSPLLPSSRHSHSCPHCQRSVELAGALAKIYLQALNQPEKAVEVLTSCANHWRSEVNAPLL